MRTPLPWTLLLASTAVLAGCDKCSGEKDKPAASTPSTPAEAAAPTAAASAPAAAPTATSVAAPAANVEQPTDTLKTTDIKVGTGAEATDGKKVSVLYTGTLVDGTKFDSTKDRGTPFSFVLGSGMVIAGWDQGLKGMKEGGVRKLVIPPGLAYGSRAVGGVIPPNSTLVFEIELLKVE